MESLGPVAITTFTTVGGAALATTFAAGVAAWARRTFRREEEQERTRLRKDLLGSQTAAESTVINLGPASTVRIGDSLPKAGEGNPAEPVDGEDDNVEPVGQGHDSIASVHTARFGLLLVDYYAYGLTQARRSFAVSLACSVLGGLVLIAGVAIAIFRADTNGEVYAGVVTSVAGVLTTSIGVLFHQQANRALKHMEDQTNKLRQDMKSERDAGTALELLDKVTDSGLRGRLQAALILRFSGAELPDTDEFGYPIHMRRSPNGNKATKASTVDLSGE
jgi:hypothetical protein